MDGQSNLDFLTLEECAEVDKALLTSRDKFSTRLAIYGLRVLKQISQKTGLPVEAVTAQQICDWIAQDEKIQNQIDLDSSFVGFFTNLVMASLKPLKQISAEVGVPVESLTVSLVVTWYEKQAKLRLPEKE